MVIGPKQRNVALLVAGCFFMENLDGTIVTTAAPRIGQSLHIASSAVGLVITSYLVTLAVLIPLGGWMIARLGNRRVFLSAIVLFTVSSLLCALSTDLVMLVAMRVLQGVGGAMMTPVGRVVAFANVDKRDLLRIVSFIVWPGLIAPVMAPLAGGVITTYANWRWIFLINIPLGVLAFIVATRLMPIMSPPPRQRLDWPGVALTSVGLGGLTYTAYLISQSANASLTWSCAAVSVAMITTAIWHLLRTPTPLLELRIFQIRTFRAAQGGLGLYFIVVSSVPFLLPLLFQTVFGWSPIKSGVLVIFVFIGNIAIKPATTFLVTRLGFRTTLITSTAGVGFSMIAIGQVRASTPDVVIGLIALCNGVFRSVGFTGYVTLTLADVPEPRMRNANVLAATVQQLGAGLAIAAATVALRLGGVFDHLASSHPSSVKAFTVAFWILAAIAFINTAKAIALPSDAGHTVTKGHAQDRGTSVATATTDQETALLSPDPA